MKNKEAKAKAKVEFKIHLAIYVGVICILAAVNLLATPGYIWFKWPLMGWGLAVIIHALTVYLGSGDKSIKEQMIEKEMEKGN